MSLKLEKMNMKLEKKNEYFQNFGNRSRIDSVASRGHSRYKGRAQRRKDASQVPGITAERCGIDPQSILEVLKCLKFQKNKIFPRFGVPPGPGPSAHTGWLERRRGASPRGWAPQRRDLDSPTCYTCPRGHTYPGDRSRAVPGAARAAQAG